MIQTFTYPILLPDDININLVDIPRKAIPVLKQHDLSQIMPVFGLVSCDGKQLMVSIGAIIPFCIGAGLSSYKHIDGIRYKIHEVSILPELNSNIKPLQKEEYDVFIKIGEEYRQLMTKGIEFIPDSSDFPHGPGDLGRFGCDGKYRM